MSSIVLCPNCGGQKTVSKPPYIAGDVNSWVDSGTPTYPCPTCGGQGWFQVGSVPQEDFVTIKYIALSSMETAENLMDECAVRADRIKELEADLHHAVAGEHSADREIERLRAKIFDIEGREDLVTTELERRACVAEDRLRVVKEMRDELLEDWESKRGDVVRLEDEVRNLRTLVDMKDMRISDIISRRDVERKTRIRRERELICIINDLTISAQT